MSERYSRVFALPENLYAVGSPVVIAAGVLLKDNQTGKVLAQLKLQSISNKIIIGVKVRLNLFDNAGNSIGLPVDFDYLDLSASRDTEFGQKTPVPIAENKTRSYTVSVQEVVFADKSTWTVTDAPWNPLPRQKTLDAVLVDAELIKQYKIAVGSNFSHYLLEEKDLWYCSCGALNHEGEDCHVCRRTLFELQTIDLDQLAKDKDARLAQEAAAAEAKAAAIEAAKRKKAKILKIVIPALCAVIAITLLTTKVIIPNSKYNNARALMEAQKYEEAIVVFESLGGFREAEQMIVSCQNGMKELVYQKAVAMMAQKAYDDAIPVLQEVEDYKDSRELIENCRKFSIEERYNNAVELMRVKNYEDAKNAFEALDGYKDSQALIQKCEQLILEAKMEQAQRLMDSQKYDDALVLLRELLEVGMDVHAEIQDCDLGILEDRKTEEKREIYPDFYLTSGKPIGKETAISPYTQGNIEVHKLTKVELDNGCMRFTLECTVPASSVVSFFNPPYCTQFLYFHSAIQSGRQTFTFDVMISDLQQVNKMSIQFGYSDEEYCLVVINNPY